MFIVAASLIYAPAAQADLVSLTLVLSGVFFTGVGINEAIENDTSDSAADRYEERNFSP